MLPHGYESLGALLLVAGGLLACLAGYRLFRSVLAIYGFIFGAMIASSVMGVTNTAGMLVAAVLGGLVGSLVLVFAWFLGVAIVGAGLGALLAHLVWTQVGTNDPPAVAVIVVAILGAVAAMILQRYVIVIGTAFGGAWTVIVGTVNGLAARAASRPASADDVWILYPMTPASGEGWVPLAWIVLGLVGTIVQLRVTSKGKR